MLQTDKQDHARHLSHLCRFFEFPSLSSDKRKRAGQERGKLESEAMGEVGMRSGASPETTMDGHSFDNAFPTLTPWQPHTPLPQPPLRRTKTFALSPWQAAFFCRVRQSLVDPRQRQEHRGDRGNDRLDRGRWRRGADGGRNRLMKGVRSAHCAHLLYVTPSPCLCAYGYVFISLEYSMVIQPQSFFFYLLSKAEEWQLIIY